MPLPLYPQTSFTRQVNCHLACQVIADIVWKPPLVPVPLHMHQFHILILHSLKFSFSIVLPSLFFRFLRKYNLYLFHSYYLLHKYHPPPRLYYPNILLYRVQIMNLLNSLWNFHQSLVSSLGEQLWLKGKLKIKVSQKVKSKPDYRNETKTFTAANRKLLFQKETRLVFSLLLSMVASHLSFRPGV